MSVSINHRQDLFCIMPVFSALLYTVGHTHTKKHLVSYVRFARIDVSWRSPGSNSCDPFSPNSSHPLRNMVRLSWWKTKRTYYTPALYCMQILQTTSVDNRMLSTESEEKNLNQKSYKSQTQIVRFWSKVWLIRKCCFILFALPQSVKST